MTKTEFLTKLRKLLGGLSENDIESSAAFYSEMIDDNIENGMTEEEAVASLGAIEDIVIQIRDGEKNKTNPDSAAQNTQVQENVGVMPQNNENKSVNAAAVVVVIIVAVMFGGAIIGIYVALWGVLIGLYAVAGILGVVGIAGLIAAPFVHSSAAAILMQAGLGLMGLSLCIPMFMLCNLIAKGLVMLIRLTVKGIKRFVTGGAA